MEPREAIRFLTFKGIRTFAMPAELKLVYETEVLAIPTVKKCCKRFAEERTLLCDDPICGRSLINDLSEAIPSISKEPRTYHARSSAGTPALQRGLACELTF
jgi:hypothetical protein